MRKKTAEYSDGKGEIMGELRRVKDDLPAPGSVVESVTITLDGEVLSFFEREAKKRKTSYVRIMHELVRSYKKLSLR